MELKIRAVLHLVLLFLVYSSVESRSWSGLAVYNIHLTPDQETEVGNNVLVTCNSLDEHFNASSLSITVYMNRQQVTSSVARATNDSALTVTIDGSVPGKHKIKCEGRLDDKTIFLAQSYVSVGYPPQPVEDLRCFIQNMKMLKCNWTKPANYVKTKYTAQLKYAYEICNSTSKESDTGEWKSCYRPNRQIFEVVIKGHNHLGNKVVIYQMNADEIALPDPPRYFSATEKEMGLEVSWKLPIEVSGTMEGMVWIQQLQFRSHRDPEDQWTVGYNGTATSDSTTVHLDTHPYTTYTLQCRLRSSKASADYWSRPAEFKIETSPTDPTQPPLMTDGSFEAFIGIKSQNITIFWKILEDYQENGPKFHYEVNAFEHETQTNILSRDLLVGTYARFEELDLNSRYTFSVAAVNSEGSSPVSSLTLPPSTELLRPPVDVEVFSHGNGSFEITWKPPKHMPTEEYSYTVFYCFYEYSRPHLCNGTLDWDVVDGDRTSYRFHSPDKSENYQYGVAINTKSSSSGIAWASCTILSSTLLDKIEEVEVREVTNTTARVHWVLDCSNKWSTITAINIRYCISDQQLCIGPVKNTTIPSEYKSAFGGVISNLEPMSTYRITIAAMRRSIMGEQSNAIYTTTDEGAPLDEPKNVTVEEVGADMVILRWEAPLFPRGTIRRYSVQVGNMHEETNHTRMEFRGLSSFRNYTVQVAACTKGDRCGPVSYPITVETDVYAPGVMKQPEVDFINNTRVNVTWFEPEQRNGPIDWYELRFRHYSQDELQNNTKFNITGNSLLLDTVDCENDEDNRYEVDIRAVNVNQDEEEVPGEWSSVKSFSCDYYAIDPGMLIGVAVGGAVIVAFLVFVAFVWRRANESTKIPPIHIPSILKNSAGTLMASKLRERSDPDFHIEEFDFFNGNYLERFGNTVITPIRSSTNSRQMTTPSNNNEDKTSEGENNGDVAVRAEGGVEQVQSLPSDMPGYVVVATPDTPANNNHIRMEDQWFIPSRVVPPPQPRRDIALSESSLPGYVYADEVPSTASSSHPDVCLEMQSLAEEARGSEESGKGDDPDEQSSKVAEEKFSYTSAEDSAFVPE